MLRLADKRIYVYKGDYRPIELYKNNEKIQGFIIAGTTGSSMSTIGTYNDIMTAYGKSGYVQSRNFCPPPRSMAGSTEEGGVTYNWQISAKEDGHFDVSGAMISDVQITKATLAAGTYTASGCQHIVLWWEGAEDYLTLPATFTLANQTEVLCFMRYSSTENLALENQYIKIEKNSRATAYLKFVGNSDFPPSPDNIMQLEAASAQIRCDGMGGPDKKKSYTLQTPELAGIPVTADSDYNYDEKISGINYYYVSDVLSGTQIKRKVGILALSGEESFSQMEIQSTTHNCYVCDISHLLKTNRTADFCICNCFETKKQLTVNETGFVLGQNDKSLYFIVEKQAFSTLEGFVQWVTKQYNSAAPVTIHYILDSELTEESNQPSFVSYPLQTNIVIEQKTTYPKLGLTKCLKRQRNT